MPNPTFSSLFVSGEDASAWMAAAASLRDHEDLEVTMVTTGEEAVEEAAQRSFDLVATELALPRSGLPGASTLARIRELCPTVTTVLVTSHDGVVALLGQSADQVISLTDPAALEQRLVQAVKAAAATGHGHHSTPDTGDPVTLKERPSPAPSTPEPATAAVEAAAPPQPARDMIAAKYEIISELGRGGMAVVYRARDTFIDRQVAIKTCNVGGGDDAGIHNRMRREVTISGGLDHPNIVTVHDAGIHRSQMYLVMELVEGRTLKDLVRERGALPVDEAVSISLQILDALDHAHARGVVHRDLKPANVLLTSDGRVKVADFGIAKILSMASSTARVGTGQEAEKLTAEGSVIGTPAYMAPEQMLGDAVDHRADLYALAVILFELLTGKMLALLVRPVSQAMLPADHDRVMAALAEVPGDRRLVRTLARAMAPEPPDRHSSARELATSIRSATGGRWRRFIPWPRLG